MVVVPSSSLVGRRVRVVVEVSDVDVSVPDVVVVGSPGLMSVVIGGLVLVTVSVDVVDPDVLVLELFEALGSTKYCDGGGGSLNWREMQDAPMNSTPSRINAPTLAPSTVEVRSCQAGSTSSESSRLATGSDSSRVAAARGVSPTAG